MIKDIESKRPKILIDTRSTLSWIIYPESEQYILSWADQYIPENYKLMGVVDIFSDATIYKWGKEAENYEPCSGYYVRIYERKE